MNAVAPENIAPISVTLPTFHADISALKNVLPLNKLDMSVTSETSHVPMAGEHKPTGEATRQVFTAATKAVAIVYTGGGGGASSKTGTGGGAPTGGGGGSACNVDGGGKFTHTEPPLPSKAVVRNLFFDIQTDEQSTWLNEVAPANIVEKSVTDITFRADRSWFKAGQAANILSIHITELTFHEPIGWFNAVAPLNIEPMSFTRVTSHVDISALNKVLPLNKLFISVTADTSHKPIAGEQAPTGETARQLFTATTKAALVVYTGRGNASGGGGRSAFNSGKAVHTEPPDPMNARVSRAVFDSQTAEHNTTLNEAAT